MSTYNDCLWSYFIFLTKRLKFINVYAARHNWFLQDSRVYAQKCPGARKDLIFELRRTVLYVEAQILSPDAADGRFSVHKAWFYAQKGPIARKDDRFEPKTYFLYVEVQIYRPDAASGRFSA